MVNYATALILLHWLAINCEQTECQLYKKRSPKSRIISGHDALEVLCNEPWCCTFRWQFDMQFSYARHLAHPVYCRPTHFNISG